MFARIKFTWLENERLPLSARVLRVETWGADRARMTWAELADMVGELECRRLFRLAIRRGSGKWHVASLPALLKVVAA